MGCSSSIASSQGTSKHVAMMTCLTKQVLSLKKNGGVRCGYICIYYHTSLYVYFTLHLSHITLSDAMKSAQGCGRGM